MAANLYLGLDVGVADANAVVIDADGESLARGRSSFAAHALSERDPRGWFAAVGAAAREALAGVDRTGVAALAVAATSGSVLAVDARGEPIGEALMYDAVGEPAWVMAIAESAPDVSAAHGASSALAKAMQLRGVKPARVLHQADWIASRFSGRYVSDVNNALKTGYDPIGGRWPDWIVDLGFNLGLLPEVLAPGQTVGAVTRDAAEAFGLDPATRVVAGTTAGCAAFLATGARAVGEAATMIGRTLKLKILSERPVFSPQYGVYSHCVNGLWLVGGASNVGLGALAAYIPPGDWPALALALDPDRPTGLDYYPLAAPGERFPMSDPAQAARVEPRPAERSTYLQAMLEGMAEIEAEGYRRLRQLGAPAPVSVRAIGGGVLSDGLARIRARALPLAAARCDAPAYGAALLARGLEAA